MSEKYNTEKILDMMLTKNISNNLLNEAIEPIKDKRKQIKIKNELLLKNKFCFNCHSLSDFEKVWKFEILPVKGIKIENYHLYYRCKKCKELYEPFDNPDFNLNLDYECYERITKRNIND